MADAIPFRDLTDSEKMVFRVDDLIGQAPDPAQAVQDLVDVLALREDLFPPEEIVDLQQMADREQTLPLLERVLTAANPRADHVTTLIPDLSRMDRARMAKLLPDLRSFYQMLTGGDGPEPE